MNLSFAGCGFLGIYYFGVASAFKKYAPELLIDLQIAGASSGALAACSVLCNLPIETLISECFRVVKEVRRNTLGAYSPTFNIQACLLEGLQQHLPDDAHKRVSGRLHISLTRIYDGKSVLISEFSSREDLIEALLCACFVPCFSGFMPKRFRGELYIDGGFTNNLPILNENTITVSPYYGKVDVCPRDQSLQLFYYTWAKTSLGISLKNIKRGLSSFFPPEPRVLYDVYQQGFEDTSEFLQRRNLISGMRCVPNRVQFVDLDSLISPPNFDIEFHESKEHIDDFRVQKNNIRANWVLISRAIKLLLLIAAILYMSFS